jgi:hypothetical protein
MPDFNGTGPLKRGRATGRGLGPCTKVNERSACQRKNAPADTKEKSYNP